MEHIHPIYDHILSRTERENALQQHSKVIWLTGLSGSGKSTIAIGLEKMLFENGFFAQVLDGDNIRHGINANLGFSIEDRQENIRRIAEVAKLYKNSGIITICSFISPTIAIRQMARQIIGPEDFMEIFVDTPIEICEQRDVKGLYKKARSGELKGFTGIDSPYERPISPNMILTTETLNIEETVSELMGYIMGEIGQEGQEGQEGEIGQEGQEGEIGQEGQEGEIGQEGQEGQEGKEGKVVHERDKNNTSELKEPRSKYGRVEDLVVWQESMKLAKEVLLEIKSCSLQALKDQIQRSAISIPSNISEGYERQSNKEFIRYLYIAKGSCGELRTQLILLQSIQDKNKKLDQFIERCYSISGLLSRLIQARYNFK
jgi:adenylylsulfate kinase